MLSSTEIQKVNSLYAQLDQLQAENKTLRECIADNTRTLAEISLKLDTVLENTTCTSTTCSKTSTATKTRKTGSKTLETA